MRIPRADGIAHLDGNGGCKRARAVGQIRLAPASPQVMTQALPQARAIASRRRLPIRHPCIEAPRDRSDATIGRNALMRSCLPGVNAHDARTGA